MTEDESRSFDLEDTFFLHGHSSKQCILKLSQNILSIGLQNNDIENQSTLHNNNTRLIPIDDIYGCLCMQGNKNPVQCHLNLNLYTLRNVKGISGIFSQKENLHRSQEIFTYTKFNNFYSNLAEVTRWYRSITYAIYLRRNLPRKCCKKFFINNLVSVLLYMIADIVISKRDKRALVFVNPAAGAGKAYRLVMEYVVGVWSEAEFSYRVIVTGLEKNTISSLRILF